MRFADVVVAADTRVEPDPEQSGRPGYHPGRDALVRALARRRIRWALGRTRVSSRASVLVPGQATFAIADVSTALTSSKLTSALNSARRCFHRRPGTRSWISARTAASAGWRWW